jgi:hypothetical protein
MPGVPGDLRFDSFIALFHPLALLRCELPCAINAETRDFWINAVAIHLNDLCIILEIIVTKYDLR